MVKPQTLKKKRVAGAYVVAGMPFRHIANAAIALGEELKKAT